MKELKKDETSIIFGLSTSEDMAKQISEKSNIPLGKTKIKKFADGEIFVEAVSSVRNKRAFIIQSTNHPANDNLMELLLFIDALKRSSVYEINVIIPYFGYSRQDRKVNGRQAISAKLVANMLQIAGANRITTFDIHSEQIVGFFDIPVDNLKAYGLISDEIKKLNISNLTIVSPDHGGISRARSLAKILDAPLAVVDKRRTKHNEAESMHILGDVKDRNVVIYDDMVDTGGTVVSAVKKMKEEGAKDVYLAVTHAILSESNKEKAIDKLINSGIKKIIITNSIKQEYKIEFLQIINLADAISETIKNHIENKSITNHFIRKYNTKL